MRFQGAPGSPYSGGIELDCAGTKGFFLNTTFERCTVDGNGGALLLTNTATVDVRSGSQFIGNQASQQGGGIFVSDGCSVTLNGTATFSGNLAPRTSSSFGGGGAIFVASGAQISLSEAVSFSNIDQNLDNDITSGGGTVKLTA